MYVKILIPLILVVILQNPLKTRAFGSLDLLKDLTSRQSYDFQTKLTHPEDQVEFQPCLEDVQAKMDSNDIFKPRFLFSGEGSNISLSCSPCLPLKGIIEEGIKWWKLTSEEDIYKIEDAGYKFPIHITKNPTRDLTIAELEKEDTGTYYCTWKEVVLNIWTLEVLSVNNLKVSPALKIKNPFTEYLLDYGLKVFESYSPWSTCNHCSRVGKRHRFANFLIESIPESPNQEYEALQIYSGPISTTLFLFHHPEIGQEDPNLVRTLTKKRKLIISFCKIPCEFLELDPQLIYTPIEIEHVYKTGEIWNQSRSRRGVWGLPPISSKHWREIIILLILVMIEVYIVIRVCINRKRAR